MKISMIPNKIVKLIHASKGDTSLRKWAFEPYDNNGAINVSNIKDQLVYKTENGGTEQLLPVNTSTPTTSYFDGTINYGTDTDVEFTYKQSSYTGQARVKSIKGNTLVWNQRCKTLASGNWATVSIGTGSLTFADGVATFSTTTNYGRFLYTPGDLVNGHKYLLSVEIKGYANAVIDYGLGTQTTYSNQGCYMHTGVIADANWHRYLKVGTFTSGTDDKVLVENVSGASNLGEIQVRNIMYFDLTQMGLDVTENEFVSLFPLSMYTRDLGSLLNFNGTGIKTTGKNLINIDDVQIGKAWNGGSNTARAAVYAPCFPNTQYTLSFGTLNVDDILLIEKITEDATTTKRLSSVKTSNPFTFTTFAESYVFGFQFNKTNISVSDLNGLNLQIEFGSSASSYEPYHTEITTLPISAYFPTGMKSAGSVYDELSNKAITRIGAVDLGTLTWNVDANYGNTFYTRITNKANGQQNLICQSYATGQPGSVATMADKTVKGNGSNNYINIKDTSYSSASDFKTAMDGVYLNYELATYTETDIQNASLVCKDIETPCYLSSGNLVCDATEELTNESGFFDAKLKLKDSSSVAYSSKFKLHVEDL